MGMAKKATLSGAILLFFAVLIGAFGAHTLAELLEKNQRLNVFETASRYHFYHGLGLMLLGVLIHFNHVWMYFKHIQMCRYNAYMQKPFTLSLFLSLSLYIYKVCFCLGICVTKWGTRYWQWAAGEVSREPCRGDGGFPWHDRQASHRVWCILPDPTLQMIKATVDKANTVASWHKVNPGEARVPLPIYGNDLYLISLNQSILAFLFFRICS